MIEKTTHITEALALLIQQYKGKTYLEGFLSSFIEQIQEAEGVLFDVLAILGSVSTQTGEQLDLLGRLVGQDREGHADAAYLRWIYARIFANRASGTPEDMFTLLTLIDKTDYSYTEYHPAFYLIELYGITTELASVVSLLDLIRPAGVGGQVLYATTSEATTFYFSSDDTEEASTDQGWANDGQTEGGFFADVEELG